MGATDGELGGVAAGSGLPAAPSTTVRSPATSAVTESASANPPGVRCDYSPMANHVLLAEVLRRLITQHAVAIGAAGAA